MSAGNGPMLAVGLGEIHTAAGDETTIMVLGLGSCVGVALYDPQVRVGGMAHIVLPEPPDGSTALSTKFATVAVPELVQRVTRLGASKYRLVCAIAGGAQVLAVSPGRHNFRIGERNISAVVAALAGLGIRPQAVNCGGTNGRSFRLNIADGSMAVKSLGSIWQEL